MAENFVGKMDSQFHSFCSESCPCLELEHKKEKMYQGDTGITVRSYVTCQHYNFCKKLVPAIRNACDYTKSASVSKMDTKR